MKNMYVLLQFFDELSGPTTYRILSKEILGAEGKERKKIPKSLNDDFKVSDKQLILKKKLMQYFGKLFNAANLGYFLHHFEGRDKFSSANYYFIIYRPQIQIKEFYLMLSVILPFSEDPNQFRECLIQTSQKIKEVDNLGQLLARPKYSELDKLLEELYKTAHAKRIALSVA